MSNSASARKHGFMEKSHKKQKQNPMFSISKYELTQYYLLHMKERNDLLVIFLDCC
jgi:hypothetical protein